MSPLLIVNYLFFDEAKNTELQSSSEILFSLFMPCLRRDGSVTRENAKDGEPYTTFAGGHSSAVHFLPGPVLGRSVRNI